jgi:hypothetical protein
MARGREGRASRRRDPLAEASASTQAAPPDLDERLRAAVPGLAGVVLAASRRANMATTKQYVHLAGTVFRDEAERLEQRLLADPERVESSTSVG